VLIGPLFLLPGRKFLALQARSLIYAVPLLLGPVALNPSSHLSKCYENSTCSSSSFKTRPAFAVAVHTLFHLVHDHLFQFHLQL
jgi:hypothetical protein